jgi:RNA polymerase sigma-70 factor (ECF subfamily)
MRLPKRVEGYDDSGYDTEEALVAGLLARDPRAWRAFARYDRLIDHCIARVFTRFSRFSEDDVREVHASLMVQLLSNDMHKLRTFDPERGMRLPSWIGLLATNAAYDQLRRVRRQPRFTREESAPEPVCERMCVEDLLDRHYRSHRVRATLASFSPRDRDFVELYFEQELEPEQIATQMNISVNTVYSKKHKLQARLATLLAHAA